MLFSGLRLHFAAGPQAELPTRILAAKWGRNKSVNGDYIVNETTAATLPAALRKVGFDSVALDFDHNSVPGSAAYQAEREPRHVASHGTLSVVPGEGLYYTPSTWTPEGRAAVLGGHFPDISPAIVCNKAREVVFVHSVGLCRQGATEGLRLDLHTAGLAPLSPITMDKYKALLLTLLGLAESADDTAIEAAAKGLAAKVEAAKSTADAAAAKVETMSVSLEALRKQLTGDEAGRLVAEALAQGKVVTHSMQLLPLEHLKAVLAELPAGVVPLDRRTPAGIQTHSSQAFSPDLATERDVFTQLGVKAKAA